MYTKIFNTKKLGTELFQFISNLKEFRGKKYYSSSFEENWIIYCPVRKIKSTKKNSKAEKKVSLGRLQFS